MKWLRVLLILASMGTSGTLVAAAEKPKAAETPKIAGLEIARPHGGFLGLDLVNSNFVLTFYDRAKQKTAPDVARAVLRWPVKYQRSDERTVLNPAGDGSSLSSPLFVRPPHNFRLSILLFVDTSPDAIEAYNVQFQK